MSNIKDFSGLWTELITPFDEKGNIDFLTLDKLIERQINSKVKGISFLGVTGESPTLSKTEKLQILQRGIRKVGGRCLVMVSAGTNSTNQTIGLIKEFTQIQGIDAFSIIVPYYNKPTQEGLYKHFEAISDSTSERIFIYNNPSRTGVNLEPDTLLRLSRSHYNIIGIKDSSGDLDYIQEIIDNKKDDFVVLSGLDNIAFEIIKKGGHGLISVLSNIFPYTMIDIVEKSLKDNFGQVKEIVNELDDFFGEDFYKTNPLPIKFALSVTGLIKEKYRLPLCEMDLEQKSKRINILQKYSDLN